MSETDYKSQFDLSGRVAVVTGGAGFLGREFCQAYAQFGALIAVVDKDGERARTVADEIKKTHDVEAAAFPCDISDVDAVERVVENITRSVGPIRILHNNAANQRSGLNAQFAPFETYSPEDWRRVMSVDLDGSFHVLQAAGRAMASHGDGGSIIQTASIYGMLAPDNRIYEGATYDGNPHCSPAVYSAAKAATISLTRWLATYWSQSGIRANVIVPGGVEDKQNDTFQQRYGARVPLGRLARKSELGAAALFLASDASSYITGQCLFIDGGLSAW